MNARAYEESRVASVLAWWRAVAQALAGAYRASRLGRFVRGVERVTRQSWLVRWLTAEPEPDVIVVDLSETWTVGPLIRVVDATLPPLARGWRGSAVRRGIGRAANTFRAAPVQLTSAVVLAALLVGVARTWSSATDVSLALACFLAAAALAGLRVTWTWDELVESWIGRLAAALLLPPEPSEMESDDGRR